MKEIEIKAKLREKDKIIEKLKSLGCVFEAPITQEDIVYAKNVATLKDFHTNDIFLRIRVKNGKKIIFTLKKKMSNNLDALEHETEISSKKEMEQALLLMGYKEAIRVSKTRVVTHYDGCEICIDDVEKLGAFIEMEKLVKEGNSEEIQNKLFEFFISIGIKKEDRLFSGYDILMYEYDGRL